MHVVATRRGDQRLESRASMMTGWPNGYGWQDPSAIPPPGLGQLQRAGVMVTEDTLLQVDVVFTALRIISNNMIKMGDLRAYEEALSSDNIPYREFLAAQPPVLADMWGGRMLPCDGMTRTVFSMALFGEAFWFVLERDRLAYPSALEVLHPAFMEVKNATKEDVAAGRVRNEGDVIYLYGSGANRRRLDPDDVIHIPFKSLPGMRRGLKPVQYVGVAGALAMAAYEFGSTWFSQGAAPSFLLTTDQKLGQEEVNRLAQRFLIGHSGLNNAHLPLVLDNGLKATKVMANPDEAQYLNTLEYARSVIGSWFGIPGNWMGNALQRQAATPPHTRQEDTLGFLQNTLSGYMIPLEQAVSTRILRPGVKAAFDDSGLARPDAQFLAQEIQALRMTQAATVNDIRVRKLHWPPLPDPEADQAMAPLAANVAPSQTAKPPSEPPGGKS